MSSPRLSEIWFDRRDALSDQVRTRKVTTCVLRKGKAMMRIVFVSPSEGQSMNGRIGARFPFSRQQRLKSAETCPIKKGGLSRTNG